MTLDCLAASIQRELLGIGKKCDRLDERITGVEEKVVGLDQKMDRVRVEIVDELSRSYWSCLSPS
jgi:hypothetical protein